MNKFQKITIFMLTLFLQAPIFAMHEVDEDWDEISSSDDSSDKNNEKQPSFLQRTREWWQRNKQNVAVKIDTIKQQGQDVGEVIVGMPKQAIAEVGESVNRAVEQVTDLFPYSWEDRAKKFDLISENDALLINNSQFYSRETRARLRYYMEECEPNDEGFQKLKNLQFILKNLSSKKMISFNRLIETCATVDEMNQLIQKVLTQLANSKVIDS